MLDPNKINEVIRSVLDGMPEGLKQMPEDIRAHVKAALNTALVKLDVVTREEFDVQVQVLKKTRAKLEALEQQLASKKQTP